jgi:acyl-CoA dehydrogenase
VARDGDEARMRQAASALYHVTSAALLAAEGARLGQLGRDARRLLLARMVLEHRLRAQDPLEGEVSDARAVDALLDEAPLPLAQAQALV